MIYSVRAFPVAELPVPRWECHFGQNDCRFHTLIFYTWLLQGGGKNVLIDAGPPPKPDDFGSLREACQKIDPGSTMKQLLTLEDVYSQAGITGDSIDVLLITQPITYCSGGLIEDSFPNAVVYLSRAGVLEFLLENPGHPPRHLYFTETTWNFLRRLAIENRLILADESVEVLEGLWFETTGGHHAGSAGIKIATAEGLLGILETAFTNENIENGLPIGVAENAGQCRNVIRRYRRDCRMVLAAHDNTLLERFPGGRIA
jgi:glyoxylase-like metal-dependent hydrolase (beta-lactamase superfamily II)